jgi:4-amino-4-deoxy-L-arabinose transferase-like glycosyltransferase
MRLISNPGALPRVEWSVRTFLVILLALALLLTLAYELAVLAFRYPLDYGEAMTVDLSLRLLRGQTIYPADLSRIDSIVCNYPPLFMTVQAALIGLFGPAFWPGRLISSLSTWLAAYFLARLTYRHSADRLASAVTGLIFLAFPYVLSWSSLARIDCLALGLSVTGLYFLTRADLTWKHFWLGAALLLAAIYTRQSYLLALPATAFCVLLFKNWRKAFLLAGVVGGATLLLFLLLNIATGGGFYLHIIAVNLNQFSFNELRFQLTHNLAYLAWGLLLIAAAAFATKLHDRNLNILLIAFLLSAGASSLTIGKAGSNYNYFLELCAALSLAAGMAFAAVRKNRSKTAQVLLMVVLIAQTLTFFIRTANQQIPIFWTRWSERADLQKLENLVISANGPVLADEYLGLVTLQNRLAYIQPFSSAQAARDGFWDETPLVQNIQAKTYPLILIWGQPGSDIIHIRWTDRMLAAIEQNYIVSERLADTAVYVPKKP